MKCSKIVQCLEIYNENIFSGGDKRLRFWNYQSKGKKLKSSSSHNGPINCVLFANEQLFSSSEDKTIKLWDYRTRKCLKTIQSHELISCMTIFQDFSHIVTGSTDGSILLWCLDSCEPITLNSHGHPVTSLAIYDSNTLLSAANDFCIRVWDLDKLECLISLRGHEDEISSLIVHKPTKQIFSASLDGTIRCWDIEKCNCIATFNISNPVLSIDSNDDIFVAGIDNGQIIIWDLYTHLELRRIDVFPNSPVTCLRIDVHGNIACSGHKFIKVVVLYQELS